MLESIDHQFLFLIAGLLTVLGLLAGKIKLGHKLNILQSYRALRRFKKIGTLENGDARQFGFLRKHVNPFVFEEMILTALKKSGHRIKRNKRYTGDGGIDGQCWIHGKHYLIQAKRYSHYIDPQQVKAFAAICEQRQAQGLFVHTGKTGQLSRFVTTKRIEMISGHKLVSLLNTGYKAVA